MLDPDAEHLKFLSLAHYLAGTIAAAGGAFVGYQTYRTLALAEGFGGPLKEAASVFQFVAYSQGLLCIAVVVYATCLIVAGRLLTDHRGFMFCMSVAMVNCLFMPLGTVLGVLTIIVLCRPSVMLLFGRDTSTSR